MSPPGCVRTCNFEWSTSNEMTLKCIERSTLERAAARSSVELFGGVRIRFFLAGVVGAELPREAFKEKGRIFQRENRSGSKERIRSGH